MQLPPPKGQNLWLDIRRSLDSLDREESEFRPLSPILIDEAREECNVSFLNQVLAGRPDGCFPVPLIPVVNLHSDACVDQIGGLIVGDYPVAFAAWPVH